MFVPSGEFIFLPLMIATIMSNGLVIGTLPSIFTGSIDRKKSYFCVEVALLYGRGVSIHAHDARG